MLLQEVAALYVSVLPNLEASKARVKVALKSFVDANDNPSTSSNYSSREEDPVHVFLDMLPHARRDAMWTVLILRALKILSRKQPNRLRFGPNGLKAIVEAIISPLNNKVGPGRPGKGTGATQGRGLRGGGATTHAWPCPSAPPQRRPRNVCPPPCLARWLRRAPTCS